jgi:protein TonB
MNGSSSVSAFDRFGLTLFLAAAWHAVVILGVSFTVDPLSKAPPPERTLEIMVVQNRTEEKKPEKADFLAQASQEGGGEEKEVVRPTTAMPVPSNNPLEKPLGQNRPASAPTPPPTQVQRKVISTPQQAKKKTTSAAKKRPVTPKKRLTTAQIMASSQQEIARLTASLDRKTKAYAKRPRRKSISASTREYKYANYLDAWKRKVERIGNLNYPEEAKKRRLYGNLMLHVALKPDGTVHSVRVRKSSGHKLLDDAAIRIVKLAAPYAPFPKEIREETDILDITRTWQFLSSNRLLAK